MHSIVAIKIEFCEARLQAFLRSGLYCFVASLVVSSTLPLSL